MCRELLRFRLLAFYPTLDQAFLLLFFVGLAVRFLFFRTYGLYTKPVAVVHKARRNIQVENKNNRSARKHKRQTSRKGSKGFKKSKGVQRDLQVFNRFKGIERDQKGSAKIY